MFTILRFLLDVYKGHLDEVFFLIHNRLCRLEGSTKEIKNKMTENEQKLLEAAQTIDTVAGQMSVFKTRMEEKVAAITAQAQEPVATEEPEDLSQEFEALGQAITSLSNLGASLNPSGEGTPTPTAEVTVPVVTEPATPSIPGLDSSSAPGLDPASPSANPTPTTGANVEPPVEADVPSSVDPADETSSPVADQPVTDSDTVPSTDTEEPVPSEPVEDDTDEGDTDEPEEDGEEYDDDEL